MASLILPNDPVWLEGIMPDVPAKGFSLEELYRHLASTHDRDGNPLEGRDLQMTIEIIHLADGRLLIVDEDGKGKRLAINPEATNLCTRVGAGLSPFDIIVGPALICEGNELL